MMKLSAEIGERVRVFDPSVPDERRYLNDHTLIQAEDGRWHLFGITAAEPARPLEEVNFVHATATDLLGPWAMHDPVIEADVAAGETHVWAPHVIHHDAQYWMFYTGGTADHERYRIQVATSDDLWTWQRDASQPLFEDGYDARDPMVLRLDQEWVMYYTRTSSPGGGTHQVAVRTSPDLRTWSAPTVAFDSGVEGTFGGPTESPFVVPVQVGSHRAWLLSVCDAGLYDITRVYLSEDPMRWDTTQLAFTVPEHCPEYTTTDDGQLWVSGAGWDRGGLHLRRLRLVLG